MLGLLWGSFATSIAHRVPLGVAVSGRERSRCPHCDAPIAARDNLPVLSYILLKGKCRNCGNRISVRYPMTELASGLLFLGAVWEFEALAVSALYSAFFWTLIVLTVIDLEHKLLPDRIVFPAFAIGLLLIAFDSRSDLGRFDWATLLGTGLSLSIAAVSFPWPPWKALKRKNIVELDDSEDVDATEEVKPLSDSVMLLIAIASLGAWLALVVLSFVGDAPRGLAGALTGAGIFSGFLFAVSLFVPQGMGGGDVKLALVLGSFLGYISSPGHVLAGMFLSFMVGGVMGMIIMIVKGGDRKMQIPFGPYLAAGTVLAVFIGDRLIDFYVGLV